MIQNAIYVLPVVLLNLPTQQGAEVVGATVVEYPQYLRPTLCNLRRGRIVYYITYQSCIVT